MDSGTPRNLKFGLLLLAILLLTALTAPWISGDPIRTDLDSLFLAPSIDHPLGTDGLGRDVAARTIHSSRVSLSVGLLAAAIAIGFGAPLGALAGFFGGWVDRILSRLLEALLCLPTLLVVLVLMHSPPAGLESWPDSVRIAVLLGLFGWMPVARYVRAEVMRIERRPFVRSARASGVGSAGILLRHVLPSAATSALVTAAFAVGSAIGLEAALSFLGLGISPPTPTWGGQLAEARLHLVRAWWLPFPPGLALFLSVLACHLCGEGMRDSLDPEGSNHRLRKRPPQ